MSMVARIVSRFVILGLLAGTVAMVVYLPSREQIGSAVDQVTGWFRPGMLQLSEKHGLGPAKRRWIEQLKHVRSAGSRNHQQGLREGQPRRQPVAGFGQTS